MKKTYTIHGMSCNSCKEKIEKKLSQTKGIKKYQVRLKEDKLNLEYNPEEIKIEKIKRVIKELGYEMLEEDKSSKDELKKIGIPLGSALLIFIVLNRVIPDFSMLLTEGRGVSIIMLFIIGITTSFHCVSMCGGLALSQIVNEGNPVKKSIMYNAGRVISYTLLGGIVGAIGQGITLENEFFAIVPIILGALMVTMGLRNVGIISLFESKVMKRFNLTLARLRGKVSHDQGPFVLGLVNGLMPCGPLQLMQIYALGTGSFMQGALAMFAFSLGTVPLMLGLGIFMNKLSISARSLVFKMGGFLVIILGISMMMNGLSTIGLATVGPKNNVSSSKSTMNKQRIEDGYQVVEIDVTSRHYKDIVVQKGIPVKFIINVASGALSSCNYAINIPEYDIVTTLQEGENMIEFNPIEEGTYAYSCWMGMIRNTITVIDGDVEDYISQIEDRSSFKAYEARGFGAGRCH
ncbi:MAG: sulfite exporter TauE/SafE family protein [Cellulosilyticaceae bacterium]